MKAFQQVRMNLASLGFRPNQSPFNKTQLWTYVKVFLSLLLLCLYLVREANTPKEYMDSIFMTAATFFILIGRVSTLLQNATIFDLIDSIEKVITGSELNSFKIHLHVSEHPNDKISF